MINGSLSIPKLVEFQILVQKHMPDCDVIIAGGCLRDLLHSKPVNDIDVFIRADYEAIGPIEEIFDLPEGFRMYPVQLIFLYDDPRTTIADFDFGLCQVMLDRGKLQMTPAYWKDHDTQTFHHLAPKDRTTPKSRVEGLQAKYSGWRFKGVEKIMREVLVPKAILEVTSDDNIDQKVTPLPPWALVLDDLRS